MIHYYAIPGLKTKPRRYRLRVMSIAEVAKQSCEFFSVSLEQIMLRTRVNNVCTYRMIVMYVMYKKLFTLKEIAEFFDGKHHATVISAKRTIQNRMDTEESMHKTVNDLLEYLK